MPSQTTTEIFSIAIRPLDYQEPLGMEFLGVGVYTANDKGFARIKNPSPMLAAILGVPFDTQAEIVEYDIDALLTAERKLFSQAPRNSVSENKLYRSLDIDPGISPRADNTQEQLREFVANCINQIRGFGEGLRKPQPRR